MKTKNIIFFTSLFLFAGIGELFFSYPAPTYNPFDDVFNVSRERLVKEGCIEDIIECGYVNITKDFGDGISMYYQFFGDEKIIQAKGMFIEIDTLWNNDDFEDGKLIDNRKRQFDSLKIDFNAIKRKLKKFDVDILSVQKSKYDFVLDVNVMYKSYQKEFDLEIRTHEGVRFLELFYSKPKSQKTWQEYSDDLKIYFIDLLGLYHY
ncbi:hypothetical protein [Thermoflexibacter ruber]|uniref:Intein N-terminal splicing region n=1 Tax=Thermoflexibacter ruber TaxID=1003 RepID=A0A1I2FIS1_9BACT|nr:hypothetical protein [Thermoflexibacter ruber]SFF04893.1 intein N-terminal splicing region [Thermoflexibacter ruber]